MEPQTLPTKVNGPMIYISLHANITQVGKTCRDCRWLLGLADQAWSHAICGYDLYRTVMLAEQGCSHFSLGVDDEQCREG